MSLRKKLKLDNDEQNEQDCFAESKYFLSGPSNAVNTLSAFTNISDNLLRIEIDLVSKLKNITFKAPVACVYNPIEYAYLTHSMFVKKYCSNTKKILFLGLNPGPWGMAQTGVPFGEVNITRDWLKICGPVDKPINEINDRPIKGFECQRSEISGKKFWSLIQNLCGTPEIFFKHSYVHNYCPLLLMKSTGANVTPADLKKADSVELHNLCDQSLSEIIKLLQVDIVIAIGRFAQKRAEETLKTYGLHNVRVHFLVHPSPIIPKNENWYKEATKLFSDLNILQYFMHQ